MWGLSIERALLLLGPFLVGVTLLEKGIEEDLGVVGLVGLRYDEGVLEVGVLGLGGRGFVAPLCDGRLSFEVCGYCPFCK